MRLHINNTPGNPPIRIDVPEENCNGYVRYPEIGLTVVPSMMGDWHDPLGQKPRPVSIHKWGKTPEDLKAEHSRWLYDQEKARAGDLRTINGMSAMLMNNCLVSPCIGNIYTADQTPEFQKMVRKEHRRIAHSWDLDENGRPLTWWSKLCNKVRTWLKI